MPRFILYIVSLLFLCSDYSPEFGDCWPLDPGILAVIKNNKVKLIRYLCVDELIGELSNRKCITDEKLHCIRQTKPNKRNDVLLDLLMKTSVENFQLFVACLRVTQSHLVPLLTGDTGMNVMESSEMEFTFIGFNSSCSLQKWTFHRFIPVNEIDHHNPYNTKRVSRLSKAEI